MAHSYFKPPDYLDYESVQELPKCWENWKKQFLIFMEATESNSKSDGVKVSMFLNLIGQKAVELYETFTFAMVIIKSLIRLLKNLKNMLIYTKVLQLTGICFLENGKKMDNR